MTEKDLIKKIRELKQIQPKKDWVVLTKSQIFGKQREQFSLVESLRLILYYKPAYAGVLAILILFGLFGFSQNSLPGDLLYPLKKITEKSQAVFVSEDEKPKYQLEIANKRLEELNKVATTNQVKNLASAIEEYQISVSRAAEDLKKIKEPEKAKEVVIEIKKLEAIKQKVEKVLATKIDADGEENGDSIQELYKTPAEVLIQDSEKRTLSEENQEILKEAKELYQAGSYSAALEKILLII